VCATLSISSWHSIKLPTVLSIAGSGLVRGECARGGKHGQVAGSSSRLVAWQGKKEPSSARFATFAKQALDTWCATWLSVGPIHKMDASCTSACRSHPLIFDRQQVLGYRAVNGQPAFSFNNPVFCAVEEDRTWFTMEEEEEVNVKLEVADELWTDLLTDTARVLVDLDAACQRR